MTTNLQMVPAAGAGARVFHALAYQMAQRTAEDLFEIKTADRRGASLKFIWTEGMPKSDVQVTAKQGGVSMSGRLAVTVTAPEISEPAPGILNYTSKTGEVKFIVLSKDDSKRLELPEGEQIALIGVVDPGFLTVPPEAAGILYTASVEVPGGFEGDLGYIQLVKTQAKENGKETVASSEFVLDDATGRDTGKDNPDNFFYLRRGDNSPTDEIPKNDPKNQTVTLFRRDFPSEGLQRKGLNVTKVTRSDQFRTYLMFRPTKRPNRKIDPKTGSVPVPLRRLDWHWEGTVQRINKLWKLIQADRSKGPSGVKITTSLPEKERFPEWEKSVTNL